MDTHSKLLRLVEDYRSLEIAQDRLRHAKTRLKESERDLKKQKVQHDKELDDLDSMEGLSMKGLFYKVLGSKEQQIEKERQEYLKASLLYNELKEGVELLEFEIEVLERKVSRIPEVQEKLVELKSIREKEILNEGGTKANDMRVILLKQEEAHIMKKELEEANQAVSEMHSLFMELRHHLKKAHDWGKWDTMSKKSNYYGWQKRGALDRARQVVSQIKNNSYRVKKELSDIGYLDYYEESSNVEYSSFAEVFFDNIITDWIIQRKIKSSLNTAIQEIRKLEAILAQLAKSMEDNADKIFALEEQRNVLLLKSNDEI